MYRHIRVYIYTQSALCVLGFLIHRLTSCDRQHLGDSDVVADRHCVNGSACVAQSAEDNGRVCTEHAPTSFPVIIP